MDKFKPQTSGTADAEVRMACDNTALRRPLGFMRRQVKSILTTKTQMVHLNGTMVWQTGVAVNQATNPNHCDLPEELKNNFKKRLLLCISL